MSDKNEEIEDMVEDIIAEVEGDASESEEQEQEDTRTEEEKLRDELTLAEFEVQKYKDEYLRVHADFDNSKKRLEREKATAVAYSNESFARDMLGVLDSFDNALSSMNQVDTDSTDETIAKYREGLELTYEQMTKALSRNGVDEIATDGEFDPNIHQAVMQVDSDEHESGAIVQVLQKGYSMKDRVLRATMVSTAK